MQLPYNIWEEAEEEEDQEFQGPWDGVLPSDYPEIYKPLLDIWCSTIATVGIYISDWGRICINCYNQLTPIQGQAYQSGGWHDMSTAEEAQRISICAHCNNEISSIRPASQCAECTEQYFEITAEELCQVQSGQVLEVLTRW